MIARNLTFSAHALIAAVLVLAAAGCAQQPVLDQAFDYPDRASGRSVRGSARTEIDPLNSARLAAREDDWAQAQVGFAAMLRQDLRNPQLQFLNGLAYDQLSRRGDRADAELARVGYQNAVNFDPGHFWSHVFLGFLELDAGDFNAAQASFARAVHDQPERWEAVYGLGVASYYVGDIRLALLAAHRLQSLEGDRATSLRLLALATAAAGDEAAFEVGRELQMLTPDDPVLTRRIGELLRGSVTERPVSNSWEATWDSDGAGDQVVVDVTIILSSQVQTETRGINLMDGLNIQFGYSNVHTSNRVSGFDRGSSRSITTTIRVPELTYSLNLFNKGGQIYQVLARPSLTAYLGRESEFFAGRTVNVGVSGINLGMLQPIDVGVGLRVTPEAIEGNRVTFNISANRSFLSQEQVGNFSESLTTFKQLVNATAEVEFGQTLLLSALSERVRDASFSKTPGVGDVPGLSLLFNSRKSMQRTESLLVLVTPMRPTSFASADREPIESVQRLRDAWGRWIDPQSSVFAIMSRLEGQTFFSEPKSGDLRWRSVITPKMLDEAVSENVLLALR